jgi:hypothetical protein
MWKYQSLAPLCAAIGIFLSSPSMAGKRIPLPKLEPRVAAELTTFLDQNALSPEEYVISKFQDHDLVFLGEFHRIQHDALLVQNLIPLLYKAGIRHLGIEFACAAHQADIDSLLFAPTYDESLARNIFWRQWVFWGFQEYIDILKAAWRFNRSLPAGRLPFRVLGLNARMDWNYVWTPEERNYPEIMKKVLPDGDSDEVMARTIQREILDKKEKALIYSGFNHAYTRFHQPIVDEKTGELRRSANTRMGNRIYDQIGDRCFLIILHSPWEPARRDGRHHVYAVEGVIDALFAQRPPEKRRVGFDVKGSPFGRLSDHTSVWSRSSKDFRLENYCDGWIFQKPLSQYEGCTVPDAWFTEANRLEAIGQIANPDPRVKHKNRTVESLMESLRDDTNFQKRFEELW